MIAFLRNKSNLELNKLNIALLIRKELRAHWLDLEGAEHTSFD